MPVVGFGAGMAIVQTVALDETVQLLDHPPNVTPVGAVAVNVTVMPTGTLAVHVATDALGPQLIAVTTLLLPGNMYVPVTLPLAAFGPTL